MRGQNGVAPRGKGSPGLTAVIENNAAGTRTVSISFKHDPMIGTVRQRAAPAHAQADWGIGMERRSRRVSVNLRVVVS